MSKILIIDDEEDSRIMLSEILESEGHEVIEARDGREGLEEIRRSRPDMVFLDMRMPEMDGLQVLEVLRSEKNEELRTTPVIVLTGLDSSHQVIDSLEEGANDYITKPFNVEELLARLGVQLRVQKLEREIRESERRYRTMFERSADPMVLLDESGKILQANQAAALLLDSSPEKLTSIPVQELVTTSGSAEFEAALVGAFEGSKIPIFESHLVPLKGNPLPVDIDLHTIEIQNRRNLLLHIRDIRWRKATQVWSNMVFEFIGDAIFITDGRGIILLASRSAADMTRYSQNEIVGLDIAKLHPEETIRQWKEQYFSNLREGHSMVYEGELRKKDGNKIPVEWVLALFLVDGEEFLIGVARDLTERKLLEEQLRQTQKMKAIGQLAGGIAHEFNNLLQVILGYSELLRNRPSVEEPIRGEVAEIQKAGERAASLTQRLLAFSRRQVLMPTMLDFNAVVTRMDAMLRRLIGDQIQMITELPQGLERVKADPGQIEEVILNLVVNARDAMPEGGKLTIGTENVKLGDDYCRDHPEIQPGSYVMLTVKDTGTGMDDRTLSRLFEPFFTTKQPGEGPGLGLAAVHGVLAQSGGSISVSSQLGKGSTFNVYLPAVEEAPTVEVQPEVLLSELPTGEETVLVVEDEDMIRDMVQRALTICGYSVLEATSGEDALQVNEQHDGRVHLVISDVMMPQMNGRELAERLEPLQPGVKVLYISGYTNDEVVRQGVLDESMAFLQKPFGLENLARTVREILDEND